MNNFTPNQRWMVFLIAVPSLFTSLILRAQFEGDPLQILYSGLGLIIGSGIGLGIYALVRERGKKVKLATIGIEVVLGISAILLFVEKEDSVTPNYIGYDWELQKFEEIEFYRPAQLDFEEKVSTANGKEEYQIYSSNGGTNLIVYVGTAVDSTHKDDLPQLYNEVFEMISNRYQLSYDSLSTTNEWSIDYDEVISKLLHFNTNGEVHLGLGYINQGESHYESVWLLPLEEGFSMEFISEFEAGISGIYGN